MPQALTYSTVSVEGDEEVDPINFSNSCCIFLCYDLELHGSDSDIDRTTFNNHASISNNSNTDALKK